MSTGDFALFLLGSGLGLGAGWALRSFHLARWVERDHRAVTDGHRRLYADDMPDGRRAERLPSGRYAEMER
jgi:hypothetical protein